MVFRGRSAVTGDNNRDRKVSTGSSSSSGGKGSLSETFLEEGATQGEDEGSKRSECGGKRDVGRVPSEGPGVEAGWRWAGAPDTPRAPDWGARATGLRVSGSSCPGSRVRPEDGAPGCRPRLLASSSRKWRE